MIDVGACLLGRLRESFDIVAIFIVGMLMVLAFFVAVRWIELIGVKLPFKIIFNPKIVLLITIIIVILIYLPIIIIFIRSVQKITDRNASK